MLSRQRNQPSKITVHHNPKPQTRLNLPIRPPRLRRLRPPNRRQPSRLILKRLPIILHRVLCTTLPLDAQGGIKGGLDLSFRLALRCPAPMDSGFRRNDGNCAKVPHRLNTDGSPLLDSRVRVLCATSRTTHSRSDHVRLPVARPLWIPAFAGMTVIVQRSPTASTQTDRPYWIPAFGCCAQPHVRHIHGQITCASPLPGPSGFRLSPE